MTPAIVIHDAPGGLAAHGERNRHERAEPGACVRLPPLGEHGQFVHVRRHDRRHEGELGAVAAQSRRGELRIESGTGDDRPALALPAPDGVTVSGDRLLRQRQDVGDHRVGRERAQQATGALRQSGEPLSRLRFVGQRLLGLAIEPLFFELRLPLALVGFEIDAGPFDRHADEGANRDRGIERIVGQAAGLAPVEHELADHLATREQRNERERADPLAREDLAVRSQG